MFKGAIWFTVTVQFKNEVFNVFQWVFIFSKKNGNIVALRCKFFLLTSDSTIAYSFRIMRQIELTIFQKNKQYFYP